MRDRSDILRIGIMGGTFNPVHIGHLFMAEAARQAFNLNKVLFIPTGFPPHKETPGVTGQQRIQMLQLAIENNPSFEASGWKLCERVPHTP